MPNYLRCGFHGGETRRLYGIERYTFSCEDNKGEEYEVWVDMEKLAELLPKMRAKKMRMARKGAVILRKASPWKPRKSPGPRRGW